MKQRAFTIRTLEYDRKEDLSTEQAALIQAALAAAKQAYAPYSQYQVGAAALLANGITLTGSNQENAAYPSGLCAERVALFYAGSQYPGVAVEKLAIAARSEDGFQSAPVAPCGACRQVLYETESRGEHPMEILLYGTEKIQVLRTATDLLPLPFVFHRQQK